MSSRARLCINPHPSLTLEQFDLRQSNLPTKNRERADRRIGFASGVVATLAGVTLGIAWGFFSSRLDADDVLALFAVTVVSAAVSGFAYVTRAGPIPESLVLDSDGMRVALENAPPRTVEWMDTRFAVEFFAEDDNGRFKCVMLGRSWRMFIFLNRDAFDAILREASRRGLSIRSEPLRRPGSLHVSVSPRVVSTAQV